MNRTILVVDDIAANRNLLGATLEPRGYEVLLAPNGATALKVAARAQPHLILMDVNMPEMDGYEACRQLKTMSGLAEIPVIFITANDDPESLVKGFKAGGVDYITKPFKDEEVLMRVETHIKIRTLTSELERSNQQLARAHELVRRAFGRYVSEEVATSILQSPEGLDLGGEEREVTILMSDLRGFTALAARLTPHEVIAFLNLYLEAMVEVISRYGGTIDEIIGDAILVIFGAPVASADHAAKAVACGLAMQLAMVDVNQRLAAQGAASLEMGIGIHTGRVIVGNIGSLRRTKYAAVGSNVNLTGRIESFTTGGQILISQATREQIQSPLRIDGEYKVEPKGAPSSLLLHEVNGMGEPFNLALPTRSKSLFLLPQPLPIRLTVLEEKLVGRAGQEGHVVSVSEFEAGIQSDRPLVPLCNLKLELEAVSTVHPGGEIYAKVMGATAADSPLTRIRFTSISPELKAWLCQTTGRLRAEQPPGA